MAIAPHLEPDPFDEEVNALLAEPEFVAELDRRHQAVRDGTAKLHSDEEVQARLRALGVPLRNESNE